MLQGKLASYFRAKRMQRTVFVSDDPVVFVRVALEAQRLLGGELGECAHGLDQSYWDLTLDGSTLTIHREHYLGVCVFCDADPKSVALLLRYAQATGRSIED
jgi:hypothetical protein